MYLIQSFLLQILDVNRDVVSTVAQRLLVHGVTEPKYFETVKFILGLFVSVVSSIKCLLFENVLSWMAVESFECYKS